MKAINSVYLHNLFSGIGDSIISIFVPVIILKQLGIQNGLTLAMLYVLIYYLASTFSVILCKKLFFKSPITLLIARCVIIISIPILIAFLTFSTPLVICLAILSGIAHGIFWGPIDYLFINNNSSINVAKYNSFSAMGSLIFSLLSAYVLGSTLDNSLLLVCISAVIMYSCSILPLILKQKELKALNDNNSNSAKYPRTKQYTLYCVFWAFSSAVIAIAIMILPIYLYVNNATMLDIGFSIALSDGMEIGVSYLCGYFKKHNLQLLSVIIGSILCCGSLIVIYLWTQPLVLIICNIIICLSTNFYYIAMQEDYFEQIKKDNCIKSGLVTNNISCNICRIGVVCVFLIFGSFLSIFIFEFICSILSIILAYLILKCKKEPKNKEKIVK